MKVGRKCPSGGRDKVSGDWRKMKGSSREVRNPVESDGSDLGTTIVQLCHAYEICQVSPFRRTGLLLLPVCVCDVVNRVALLAFHF